MGFLLNDLDRFDALRFEWFIAKICFCICDLINCLDTFGDLAESGVLTIKMWGIFMHDKEL